MRIKDRPPHASERVLIAQRAEYVRRVGSLYTTELNASAVIAPLQLNPREERHWFADHMSIRQSPPLRVRE